MTAAKAITFCIREGAKTHWGRRSSAPAMRKILLVQPEVAATNLGNTH